jgi:hypothetical protein
MRSERFGVHALEGDAVGRSLVEGTAASDFNRDGGNVDAGDACAAGCEEESLRRGAAAACARDLIEARRVLTGGLRESRVMECLLAPLFRDHEANIARRVCRLTVRRDPGSSDVVRTAAVIDALTVGS